MPDREYYLKTDPQFLDIRAKFLVHVEKMLALAGHKDARAEAAQILALEKLDCQAALGGRETWRERDLTYNLMTVASLEKDAPAYPWAAALEVSGLSGTKEVVVAEMEGTLRWASSSRTPRSRPGGLISRINT